MALTADSNGPSLVGGGSNPELWRCSPQTDGTHTAANAFADLVTPYPSHSDLFGWNLNYRNPEATITVQNLEPDTEYWFQMRWAYVSEATEWYSIRTGPAPTANPQFVGGDETTFSIAENNADGALVGTLHTVQSDTDPLTYSLTGADASSFAVGASTGELRVAPGVRLDYETKSSYSVTAHVTDGKDDSGATETTPTIDDTITVTIEVTDTAEPPAAPTVTATTPVSLRVSWDAPSGLGTSTVSDYDVRVFAGDADPLDEADWNEVRDPGTETSVVITGLMASTAYRVQVRAEVDGVETAWSVSGSAVTQKALLGTELASSIGTSASFATTDLSTTDWAQDFWTGSFAGGYTLGNVDVKFATAPTGVTVFVRTHTGSGLGDVVAVLANPANLVAGENKFTAPAGTRLAPAPAIS